MIKRHQSKLIVCLTVAVGLGWATTSRADSRQKALDWLDKYRETQVLFSDKDIEKLRDKLATATEEQAMMWLEDSREIREALDSPQWQKTNSWLKEFLKVQAIYSDKQIAEFREEARAAAEESPQKFIDLLLDVEAKRTGLVQGAADSARMREHQLEINEQFRQESAAARAAATKAAATAARSSPPRPQEIQPKRYQRPDTLINSMDVARWSVMRGFWPRW